MGDHYSDESFRQRQRRFYFQQLHPFTRLIDGKYREYFNELLQENGDDPVNDDSYSPYEGPKSGVVTHRSPKSLEELKTLTDTQILDYINDWDDEHRDKENWLIEIKISALAGIFKSYFKDEVMHDAERFKFR